MRRSSSLLGLAVVGLVVSGCALAEDPEPAPRFIAPEPLGDGQDAIKGGYVDPDDPAAVGVINLQGGLCSGSLLAPNLVLTARHCVSQTFDDDFGVICGQTSFSSPMSASNLYITTRDRFTNEGSDYHAVSEVVPLPVDDAFLCGQDMALLILEDVVSAEEALPYVPRVDSALAEGEQYYAIGFGSTNDSGSGSGVRRRRDELFVECAEEGCGQRGDMTFAEWVGDEGICSGDSGGPALDLQNRVVGVTSRGTSGCDDPVYGSTHAWGAWIKETASRAATQGGYTPHAWVTGWPTNPQYDLPMGDACQQPAECVSAMCYVGFCTRPCSEQAPCPTGFACEAPPEAGGGLICVAQPAPAPAPPAEEAAAAGDGDGDDGSDDAAEDGGGCTMGGRDPVTPLPWAVGVAIAGVALARRRRR